MESNQIKFRRRMRREIERLKERVDSLEGHEKEQMQHIIDILEQNHQEEESRAERLEREQERSWAEIITLLNRVESQVQELHQDLDVNPSRIKSREAAGRIVDQFFYDCQEMEKLMKFYGKKGYLTPDQLEQLEGQLRSQVSIMLSLFRRSEFLTDAVLQSYAAKIFS